MGFQAICPYFMQDTDRPTCHYYISPGLCSISNRFRCIEYLVRHPDETNLIELCQYPEMKDFKGAVKVVNPYLKRPVPLNSGNVIALLNERVRWQWDQKFRSFSQLSTFVGCLRKYWYHYRRGIKPVKDGAALVIGSAGHALLEEHYRGEKILTTKPIAKYLEARPELTIQFKAMFEVIYVWSRTLAPVADVEAEKLIEVQRIKDGRQAWFDLIFKEFQLGVDHKTCGLLPDRPHMSHRAQVGMYFLIDPDIEHFRLQYFRKTKLKLGKKEAEQTYLERVRGDVEKNPNKYFVAFTLRRSDFDLDTFRKEIEVVEDRLKQQMEYEDPVQWPCNWSACDMYSGCEYAPLCKTGQLDFRLFKIDWSSGRDETKK